MTRADFYLLELFKERAGHDLSSSFGPEDDDQGKLIDELAVRGLVMPHGMGGNVQLTEEGKLHLLRCRKALGSLK